MKYSILIPVYNVEKYITRCLQSVLEQEIRDYEVILVNDGSTDGSVEICARFCARDQRFRLLHQENMGLLRARRTALKHASGDYILFLDSDDFWNSDTLKKIDLMLKCHDLDVLVFRYQKFFSEGKIVPGPEFFEDGKEFKESEKRNYVLQWIKNPDLNAMWAKVVKRSCIDIDNEYVEFTGLSSGEDYIQSICIIERAKSIMYSKKILYNYRVNENSISFTYNPEKLKHIHMGKRYFETFLLENYPNDNELRVEFYKAYLTTLGGNLMFFYMNASIAEIRKWIEYINNQELFKKAIRASCLREISLPCRGAILTARSRMGVLCKMLGFVLKLKNQMTRGK